MSHLNGTWQLDPVHSDVSFALSYNAVGTFKGSFERFEGTLEGSDESLSLVGSAPAGAVSVKDENLEAHLLAPDFFDAEQYPKILFNAQTLRVSEDGSVKGEGELSVKGNKAPVALIGSVKGPVTDAYGKTRLGLELTGEVDRSALGLEWNAPMPDGGEVLGHEVTIQASTSFVKEA